MSTNDESSSANNVDELANSMSGMIKAISHLYAPETLYQSILPGWFTNNNTTNNTTIINNENSSDPAMERAITREHSYGHQIGCVIDALSVLVEQQPKDIKESPKLQGLIDLKNGINKIKDKTLRARLGKSGLSPDTYAHLIDKIYSSK
ncbi:hypothetical protein [Cupriavidus sp. UYPR2.512]|uniref:hypothetical protein n=1 Tax=Cupriavidus sp. UYPR2.512 TaxID=1080187 RepID=UPI0009D9D92A|nr:hypothetical protein [Cupriavidus sp. UYPR2.512]UIF87970.1 hypothetical protein KAF44_22040 [Cupriavidus necator]